MSDFRHYVTQDVVVPQEPEHEEEPIQEENLIDTTDTLIEASNNHAENTVQLSISAHQEIIQEREYLRMQCEKLRLEIFSPIVF